jgi:hypothetical protein
VLDAGLGVVGGRDRLNGGTWLAVRDVCAVAILNRRPSTPGAEAAGALRSRGLLTLDVARTTDARDLAKAARKAALVQVQAHRFAPFTLVFMTQDRAWTLGWDGTEQFMEIGDGWHVITHMDLDDPAEPRTQRLLGELRGWRPESWSAASTGLIERLAQHDEPRVCLHEGRMRTVSFSLVAFTADGVAYRHGEGRPCEQAPIEIAVPRKEEHV